MSKACVLFQFNMSDLEKFSLYVHNAAPTVLANGGKVPVAAAAADLRERTLPVHRTTIIEFLFGLRHISIIYVASSKLA